VSYFFISLIKDPALIEDLVLPLAAKVPRLVDPIGVRDDGIQVQVQEEVEWDGYHESTPSPPSLQVGDRARDSQELDDDCEREVGEPVEGREDLRVLLVEGHVEGHREDNDEGADLH